ncbi:uncharacterized protein VTP21DRAFT_6502 [Calcarisporiella thermophila]|uniref:uncharacterized protein n=1 Tax=Calcarisporiella thermophila TaxID=911321 RepID=UPI0037446DA2
MSGRFRCDSCRSLKKRCDHLCGPCRSKLMRCTHWPLQPNGHPVKPQHLTAQQREELQLNSLPPPPTPPHALSASIHAFSPSHSHLNLNGTPPKIPAAMPKPSLSFTHAATAARIRSVLDEDSDLPPLPSISLGRASLSGSLPSTTLTTPSRMSSGEKRPRSMYEQADNDDDLDEEELDELDEMDTTISLPTSANSQSHVSPSKHPHHPLKPLHASSLARTSGSPRKSIRMENGHSPATTAAGHPLPPHHLVCSISRSRPGPNPRAADPNVAYIGVDPVLNLRWWWDKERRAYSGEWVDPFPPPRAEPAALSIDSGDDRGLHPDQIPVSDQGESFPSLTHWWVWARKCGDNSAALAKAVCLTPLQNLPAMADALVEGAEWADIRVKRVVSVLLPRLTDRLEAIKGVGAGPILVKHWDGVLGVKEGGEGENLFGRVLEACVQIVHRGEELQEDQVVLEVEKCEKNKIVLEKEESLSPPTASTSPPPITTVTASAAATT